MDDHFWPAMYPGLIVGILYGLSIRGVFNIAVSTLGGLIGGLIGAAIAYEILTATNMNDGLPSVIGLIAAALAGAYLLTAVARRFSRSTPKP